MNIIRIIRSQCDRRMKRDESGVAIMSVILVMFMILIMSTLVLGIVLSQVRPTLFSNKNTRTISAAQAGVDATISQIRNATTVDAAGETVGEIHYLPCQASGAVDGSDASTSFSATIRYYKEDPEGREKQWLEDEALECFQGPSAFGLKAVPHFAIITSIGMDETATVMSDVADRTIEVKYTFPLTTRTISGGQIMDSNSQFCLVAETLTTGSRVRYRKAESESCKEKSPQNLWSWRSDYMIHLSSTDLDGQLPLCLSGRASNSTPVAMTLRPCTLEKTDPLGQRFSWTGQHTWLGQNSSNTGYGNSYIVNSRSSVREGDTISVSTSTNNPKPVPLPAVGKGNASSETDQVVNQSLFGRCLDVTDEQIDKAFMITYPCKQDPTGNGSFSWNHKWYYAEPDADQGESSVKTTISVRPGGTKNCLITTTREGIVAGGRPDGVAVGSYKPEKFPRFRTSDNRIDCSSASAQWTRNGDTGNPTTSWTIVDVNGRCLSASGSIISGNWNSIVVETCNGKDYQKWNVPDDPLEASLGDYKEVAGN